MIGKKLVFFFLELCICCVVKINSKMFFYGDYVGFEGIIEE